jgi:hypothetical protein
MDISMTVQTVDASVTINETAPETFARSNNTNNSLSVAGGMLRVIKRMAQAMDVDFSQLIKDVIHELAPDDQRLLMTARTWPLFISQYGTDEPIIVYCGDEDCPLDAENSEILRLDIVNDDVAEVDGGNTTLKALEAAIMDHIEKRRERENETSA